MTPPTVSVSRLNNYIKRRLSMDEKLQKLLVEGEISNFKAHSSGHLYITRITGCDDQQRREIITKMAEKGVATNVHYKPLPMMTAYKALGNDIKDFPNAYRLFENEITLPLHTNLSDEDVEYVVEVFRETVKEVRGY